MPYSQALLESAIALSKVTPETQATLRRAVSTAYYALFHFLIEETCGNWGRPEQRHALARMFVHKSMADASRSYIGKYKNASGSAEVHLYLVAYAFYQLQLERHKADYNLSITFSAADVELALELVADAFQNWSAIRNEQIAQDYLFSLLFKERQ